MKRNRKMKRKRKVKRNGKMKRKRKVKMQRKVKINIKGQGMRPSSYHYYNIIFQQLTSGVDYDGWPW